METKCDYFLSTFTKNFGTFEKGSLIHLSKKYKFTLDKAKSTGNEFYFKKEENLNFIKDFYSKNIDIGVLIGENGTGKSVLLNSIRDKNNEYSICVYEEKSQFFSITNQKQIFIENQKITKEELNYIYYTSLIDAFDNDINDKYNISNRAFLKKYDELSLDNRLSLIENDDIHKYINFSKNSKLDYVKIQKLKLYPSKTYFIEVKEKLINEHSELLLDTFFNIINNEKDENILKFIISKFDKEKIEEIYSYLLDNNDRFYKLLLSNENLLNKQYKRTLESLNKNKFNGLLINEVIEKLKNDKGFDLEDNILRFFKNEIFVDDLININFENNPNNSLIHKFEELLHSLNIDYEETLYKLNNRFINQLRDNKYYKFSIKYIIFDKIYNEIINKILSIYLNSNVNVKDERQLLKGIQKIQKLSLIKHIKEGNIRLKNRILEKTFIEELFIEAFKVGFLFIRDFMYIFKIQTNRVELFNNYLFKYINKIMKDIDEVGLIKLLFILSFNEYSKKLNDFDKVRIQNSLNILMNLDIESNKFKEYKIDFNLDIAELLINFDDFFKIFDVGERLNILKESLDIENNNIITEISDDFFNTYELIIKDSIKPFTYELYPSLSSGQKAILFIFARINDAIQKINQENPDENILILLDEADLKLHLEWQRKFVCDLIKFLNSYPNNKFYILYATHSPMILSDITNDRVVFLEKDKIKELSKDKQEINDKNELKIKSTFGANIYDIYSDSFFVNNFMGAFAQNKINEVIKIIEKNEKISDKKVSNLLKIVKNIGEPLLRNKLEDEIKSLSELEIKDDISIIADKLRDKNFEEIKQELNKYSQEKQRQILEKLFGNQND
ncbi:hypothetical protein [Aliarcobacter butzleri]|uniref:hypothetical protein n=1 Tax=Aliarcobacter butzleri TaxID=28197 RepID=UPI003AF80EB9